MSKIKKQWKIIFDMGLNICAVSVPIAALQLVVYPYLAKELDSEIYGLMLTMYSAWMTVSNSFGNVLNNIRLLHGGRDKDKNSVGDFKFILYRWLGLNTVVIGIATVFYLTEFNLRDVLFSILISGMIMLKAYIEVGFLIELNYKAVLVNGLLQSMGFLLGVAMFRITEIWQFIFGFGFLLPLIFTLWKSCIVKEPCMRTKQYKKIKRDSNLLAIATFSGSLMSYADKMVLYPLMGGYVVSTYYTATILGKIIGMLSGPCAGVILSYISKWNRERKKVFPKVLAVGGVLSVIGYGVTICMGRVVISILFPQWVEDVMLYLPVTTAAMIIQTLNSFLSPFILKFYDIKWQIVIHLTSLLVYLCGALLLWNLWGMMGFCMGTVIGQLAKTMIMTGLYYFDARRKVQTEAEK